ncbi:hypothetical protein ACFYM0_37545 [Streptomyces sp. NPDC006487]|uniref:hypothetical protein n=1 Tax=Streptomyces sp. NPDC006487 TaxID=3364748 RepID=UPI00367741ED
MLSGTTRDEEEQAARVVVADRSRDAGDRAAHLKILGLFPEPPAPEPEGRIHLLLPLLDGKHASGWV